MRTIAVPALAAFLAYACAPKADRAPSSAPRSAPTPASSVHASAAPQAPKETSAVVAERAALPVGITSFGAARHGDRVYVLGGWMGEPHAYDAAHQADAFMFAELRAGAEWIAADGLGRAQSTALVATDAGVVAIGGLRAHNATGADAELESLDRVARFDPSTGKWRDLVALPEPRSSHDAVLVDGELWVVGGWRIDRKGVSRWHTTALHRPANDPEAKWTSVEVPYERRAHAVVGLRGKLVLVGGMTPAGPTTDVEVLDVATNTWSSAPDLPGVGFGVAAVALGDAVVANGADGVLWSWTPGETKWRAIGRLAFSRFFHRMVVDEAGAIVVLGGISGAGSGQKIRATERFVPGSAAHVVALQLEAPGTAKNRQGLLLYRDRLLVVGGNNGLEQHDFAPERFVDETWELELGALAWHAKAPLPAKRQSLLSVVTSSDVGVVIGGFGHDGEVARTWADGWTYDFAKDTWTAIEDPLAGPRSQAGLVEHHGKLWLLGGLDYDPRRAKSDTFRHPRKVMSSALAPVALREGKLELPHQRRAFGGALLGREYIMIGGLAEGFAGVKACQSLGLDSGKIRDIACPTTTRTSPELVAVDGRLVLAGGIVDGEPESSIEVYDPATDAWHTLDVQMPLPIPHLRLLAWDHRVLAYSAHDAEPKIHVAVLTLPPR